MVDSRAALVEAAMGQQPQQVAPEQMRRKDTAVEIRA